MGGSRVKTVLQTCRRTRIVGAGIYDLLAGGWELEMILADLALQVEFISISGDS